MTNVTDDQLTFANVRHSLQMVKYRLETHLICLQNEAAQVLGVDKNGHREQCAGAMVAVSGKISSN